MGAAEVKIGRTLDGLLEVKQKSSLAPPNSSGAFPGTEAFSFRVNN